MLEFIEGQETPFAISALVMCQKIHGHVSGKMFDEAMKKHPEYFPVELECRRKAVLEQYPNEGYQNELWKEVEEMITSALDFHYNQNGLIIELKSKFNIFRK